MIAPKPCPFCGSEILNSEAVERPGERPFGFVDCLDCEASGPSKHGNSKEDAKERGIVAWNKAIRDMPTKRFYAHNCDASIDVALTDGKLIARCSGLGGCGDLMTEVTS